MFGFGEEPSFARLREMQKQQAERQKQIGKLEDRLRDIEIEGDGLLNPGDRVDAAIEAVTKREALRQQYKGIETEIAQQQSQIRNYATEVAQLVDAYNCAQGERKQLISEISRTPDGEAKDKLWTELAKTLRRLGWCEDNAKLTAEAEKIERELADRCPYLTLTEAWHWVNGQLIRERDHTEGPGRVAYGKGARLLKSEAARLGVS